MTKGLTSSTSHVTAEGNIVEAAERSNGDFYSNGRQHKNGPVVSVEIFCLVPVTFSRSFLIIRR